MDILRPKRAPSLSLVSCDLKASQTAWFASGGNVAWVSAHPRKGLF